MVVVLAPRGVQLERAQREGEGRHGGVGTIPTDGVLLSAVLLEGALQGEEPKALIVPRPFESGEVVDDAVVGTAYLSGERTEEVGLTSLEEFGHPLTAT